MSDNNRTVIFGTDLDTTDIPLGYVEYDGNGIICVYRYGSNSVTAYYFKVDRYANDKEAMTHAIAFLRTNYAHDWVNLWNSKR